MRRAVFVLMGVLLMSATMVGFLTRISFSDYASDPSRLNNLPYIAAPYSVAEERRFTGSSKKHDDSWLIEQSELIVHIRFNGERKYYAKSFLSSVEVAGVYKGSVERSESDIMIYEPLGVYQLTDHRAVVGEGAYLLGGTLMRSGAEYVLFLKHAPARMDVPKGYVLLESPLAKLPVSRSCPYRLLGEGEVVSMSETAKVDLLVASEDDFRDYDSRCLALLSQLVDD